jgi:P4 family phage/plasmid primase-like protien
VNREYTSEGGEGRASPEEIRRFWRHIYGKGEGFLCIATADRVGERLEGVRQEYFSYPAEGKDAAEHALRESERGREVYHTAHLLTKRERKKKHAARVWSLWADLDGAPVPENPKPTAVIESSPGRYHAYWRFSKLLDPEQAEALNKRLTYEIGADRGKWSLATLLRPPHTANHKRGDPTLTTVFSLDAGREYDPGDLLGAFEEPSENGHGGAAADNLTDEPPVRLSRSGLRIWRGEQAKYKSGGEIDRSASLFKIGGMLARAGATERVIAEALRERDEALGWNKYTDRPDDTQYAAIAAKVTSEETEDGDDDVPPSFAIDEPAFNRTDLGNAERLIARHSGDLRYVHPWKRWLVWDDTRWKPDASGEVERRARETVRSIYAEAEAANDKDERRAIARHATASEARSKIDAMIALARSMVPAEPDDLDADPWVLNVKNGTIDLRTGKLRPHDREDLITRIAPGKYDPDAQAPTFEAFLKRILPSETLRGFVQRAVGYAASGEVTEEVLPILHGTGDNGKTTLVNAVMDALGDYATEAAPELLLTKRGAHPTELADLFGARFVAATETDEGRRLAESLVKQITGRDRIKARRMREDFWEFEPTHTVFLATNHKPEVRGTDHAIWRRIRLVPFEVTIPEGEKDKRLSAKLRKELPGILAWVVRGFLDYQRGGLGEPEEVKAATQGYRSEMDVLAAFIEDRCVEHPNAKVASAGLYSAYRDWCQQGGEAEISQTKFSLRLKERGFAKEKDGLVFWYGIGLRDDRPDPGPGGGKNGGDAAPGSPDPEGLRPNPPNGESGIGKGNNHASGGSLGGSGHINGINSLNTPHEELIGKNPPNPPNPPETCDPDGPGGGGSCNPGNLVTSDSGEDDAGWIDIDDLGDDGPRRADLHRLLTREEAERVKRLIHQGMSPRWARMSVLGEDAGAG